jgi:hypothetical protein
MSKANWSYGDFKEAMGITAGYKLKMKRIMEDKGDTAAHEEPEIGEMANRIDFYNGAFGSYFDASVITVHELAHVWDGPARNCQFFGGCLSQEMMARTGSYYCHWRTGCTGRQGAYIPQGGDVSDYVSDPNRGNHWEDFADAVAAYVYPTSSSYTDSAGNPLSGYAPGSARYKFVEEKLKKR